MPIIKRGEKFFIKKKNANSEAVKVGIQCEMEEHPTIDEATAKTLVMDHLKEDAQYYKDYVAEESDDKKD